MGWHDRYAKAMLSRETLARDFLEIVLPQDSERFFDLDAIEVDTRSFVGAQLQERLTDIVIRVPFKREIRERLAKAGEPVDGLGVYVLIDHKSGSDPAVFAQFLEYHALAVAKAFRETGRYVAVIPMVFHTGEDRWTTPRTLHEAMGWPMEIPASLAKILPNLGYLLHSLREEPDDRLAGSPALRGGAMLMKYASQPEELGKRLPELLRDIVQGPGGGLEWMRTSLKYVCETGKNLDRGQVLAAAEQAAPGKGTAMGTTIYEELVAKGHKEGRLEGRLNTLLDLAGYASQGLVSVAQVRRMIDAYQEQGEISAEQAQHVRRWLDAIKPA